MATSTGDEYDDITRQFDTTYSTLVTGLEKNRRRGHYECAVTKKYHTNKKTDSMFF